MASNYDDLFSKLYIQNPVKIVADADAIKETIEKYSKRKSASEILFGTKFNEAKIEDLLDPNNEKARSEILESFGKYIKATKDYYNKASLKVTPADLFQGTLNAIAKEGKTTPNEKIIKALAEECGYELTNQKMYDDAIKIFKVNTKNEGKIPNEMNPNDPKTRQELSEDESGNVNPSLDGEALAPTPEQGAQEVATNFQSITGVSPEELVNGAELNDQQVADAFGKIVEYLKSKYPDLAQESALEEFQGALDGALKSQYSDSFENIPECFSGAMGKKLMEDFNATGSEQILGTFSDESTAKAFQSTKPNSQVKTIKDEKTGAIKYEVSISEAIEVGITENRAHYNAVSKILKGVSDKELRNKLGDQFADVLAKDNPGFKHSKFKDYLNAGDEGVTEIDEAGEETLAVADSAEQEDDRSCPKCNNDMKECSCGKNITKEVKENRLKLDECREELRQLLKQVS